MFTNECQVVCFKSLKLQMKCFFNTEFERAAKIRKIAVYRFLIKMRRFGSKSGQKLCRNQSKSIKFVTSCAGHVDGMKQ